jgi:hypothetical protein
VRPSPVEQRQNAAHQRIPQSGEPAGVVVRKLIHVHANNLDEHQFGKSVENALAASPLVAGLGGGEMDELVEQAVRTKRRITVDP